MTPLVSADSITEFSSAGVLWIGDFHEEYKTAPEAQHLLGWVSGHGAQAMQQSSSSASAKGQSASQRSRSMHAYVRQSADGSQVVIFDVSFPQHLSQQLEELQSARQQHDSWANGSITFADMSSGGNQKAKFYPSNAAVADWQAPLAVVCSSLCSIAASGSGRVMVKAPVQYSQVTCCHNGHFFVSYMRMWGSTLANASGSLNVLSFCWLPAFDETRNALPASDPQSHARLAEHSEYLQKMMTQAVLDYMQSDF